MYYIIIQKNKKKLNKNKGTKISRILRKYMHKLNKTLLMSTRVTYELLELQCHLTLFTIRIFTLFLFLSI